MAPSRPFLSELQLHERASHSDPRSSPSVSPFPSHPDSPVHCQQLVRHPLSTETECYYLGGREVARHFPLPVTCSLCGKAYFWTCCPFLIEEAILGFDLMHRRLGCLGCFFLT